MIVAVSFGVWTTAIDIVTKPYDTIEDVKAKIQDQKHIPPSMMRLTFEGMPLVGDGWRGSCFQNITIAFNTK